MNNTTNFLTAASIGTFAGATAAVYAVSNTLRLAFRLDRAFVPLLVALVVALGLTIAEGVDNVGDILLAIVNGCLLFLSATGLQQAAGADIKGTEGAVRHGRMRVTWFTPWIKARPQAMSATSATKSGASGRTEPER